MNAIAKVPKAKVLSPPQNIEAYDAREIIKNGVQVCLVLDEQTYFLRITRAGKLILTK